MSTYKKAAKAAQAKIVLTRTMSTTLALACTEAEMAIRDRIAAHELKIQLLEAKVERLDLSDGCLLHNLKTMVMFEKDNLFDICAAHRLMGEAIANAK